MNILITGASGLIGSALSKHLAARGHTICPLKRGAASTGEGASWDPDAGLVHISSSPSFDAVIHLAGENIAQRWTAAAKKRIRSSRVDATRLLTGAVAALPLPPKVMVCASATGFYGNRGDEILDEASGPGTGFLPQVCQAWEAAAEPARNKGIRVVSLRFGIVLAREGGALAKMLPIFRAGLGGRVGSGDQYWSWISLVDALYAVEFCLMNERMQGQVNAVSPAPCTNAEFTRTLASVVRRPAFIPAPAFALRAVFGEMATATLLASTRAIPTRLTEAEFRFDAKDLERALQQELVLTGREPQTRAGN